MNENASHIRILTTAADSFVGETICVSIKSKLNSSEKGEHEWKIVMEMKFIILHIAAMLINR